MRWKVPKFTSAISPIFGGENRYTLNGFAYFIFPGLTAAPKLRACPLGSEFFNFLSSKNEIFIYYKGKDFTFSGESTIIENEAKTQEVVKSRHGEENHH